jgi:hypothetical protein
MKTDINDVSIIIMVHELLLANPVLESIYPLNGEILCTPNSVSFSKICNEAICKANTETIILCNYKSRPTFSDCQKLLDLLDDGFGFVGLYRFGFFGFRKDLINRIGFFDERLLGVGEEDGDMVFRYINKYGQRPKNITSQNLFNISSNENQENMKKGIGKYSLFNRSFMFNHKYSMQSNGIQGMFDYPVIQNIPDANLYPYEKFYLDNINNL